MKRGCLNNFLFALLAFLLFGASTWFWFTFFVKGKSIPTPNLVGKSVADAKAACSDIGLKMEIDTKYQRNSDKVPAGNIVWQNRTPGTTSLMKRGATIRVELSAGPLILRVPDLDRQTPRTALLRLGQQNLRLGSVAYFDSDGPGGIAAEDPPKGTVVAANTNVSLLVASPAAPPSYVMPDLIDRPLDQVRPALEAKKLNVSTVKFEEYPGIADGIIIRQYPLRGAPVSARDPITVVVSRAAEHAIIEQPATATTTTQ
jgi:serine/threonine-protein kinase